MTDEFLRDAMSAAVGGDAEALDVMMSRMTDVERAYFEGYVSGYVEAVRHLQGAGSLESYIGQRVSSGNPLESTSDGEAAL